MIGPMGLMGLIGPMGPIGLIGLIGPMGLIGLIALAGCSEDVPPQGETPQQPQTELEVEQELDLPIQVSVSAPAFAGGASQGTTRAWEPPTGYYLYDASLYGGTAYRNLDPLGSKAIDAFFTINDEDAPLHGRLRYVSSKDKWSFIVPKVDPETIAGGTYYAYGYIPRDAADNAEISLLEDTYAKGAVLTVKSMRAAGYDACVIIGAKEGPDEDHDGGLKAGDFGFVLDTGKDAQDNPKPNYLYLLFDHLCAALELDLRVDPEYDALRTIVVKELRLSTANGNSPTRKTDVTVTLQRQVAAHIDANLLAKEPLTEGKQRRQHLLTKQHDADHQLRPEPLHRARHAAGRQYPRRDVEVRHLRQEPKEGLRRQPDIQPGAQGQRGHEHPAAEQGHQRLHRPGARQEVQHPADRETHISVCDVRR